MSDPISADQMAKLIQLEVDELLTNVRIYECEKKRQDGRKPAQGDGAEWKMDGYGVCHLAKKGLPQGATATAIDRKIITIREHLNKLRELV